MAKRGSRRKSSARKQRAARAAADKPQGRLQRWTRRLLVWGGAIALLGALFIALAVAFAARSMPSYYQLKATQTAQTGALATRTLELSAHGYPHGYPPRESQGYIRQHGRPPQL